MTDPNNGNEDQYEGLFDPDDEEAKRPANPFPKLKNQVSPTPTKGS